MKTGAKTAIDKATNQQVTIVEKLDGGLFVVQFAAVKGKEIAEALAGQRALRKGSELQREENQENPLQTMKEIHRELGAGMRSLSDALYDSGLSANPDKFSGRAATTSDLGDGRLGKLYKKILGTNRYDGLIKNSFAIDKAHIQAYRELHGLDEEEDVIVHFNRQAAASFVQMVKDLPDLAATRFIKAFFDLAGNGWIREGGSYSNESIRGSDEFETGVLLLADRMSRSMPQRDHTAIIRSEFLSSIGTGGSGNSVSIGALWIGQQTEKKVSDMIIGEEGYTTPWMLGRLSGESKLSCIGGGTSTVRIRKTGVNELMIVENTSDGFDRDYRRDAVETGQIIRTR